MKMIEYIIGTNLLPEKKVTLPIYVFGTQNVF